MHYWGNMKNTLKIMYQNVHIQLTKGHQFQLIGCFLARALSKNFMSIPADHPVEPFSRGQYQPNLGLNSNDKSMKSFLRNYAEFLYQFLESLLMFVG